MKKRYKSQKGISLLTLIVTIIVIIILSLIIINNNDKTMVDAVIADYKYELKGIEVSVSSKRAANQQQGIGEEYKEQGFNPVIIENPPEGFKGFEGWNIHGYDEGECYGYVVDLESVKESGTKKGYDYKKYQTFDATKTITFGKAGEDNDVYIYDADGKVYYAKGFYIDGGVYYSDELTQDGPIINIEKQYNEITNVVNLTIDVDTKAKDVIPVVKIDGTVISIDADGTYKYTVTKNGTYRITAAEDENNVSTKKITITEIKGEVYTITYYFPGVSESQTQEMKPDEVSRIMPPVKVVREGYVLEGFSKTSGATNVEYKLGQVFKENNDVALYAVWREGTPNKYTITFNANGGTGAPSAILKTEGETITLPIQLPIKEDYTFVGWNTSNDGNGEMFGAGSQYSKEGNAVLFATWQTGETKIITNVNPPSSGKVVKTGTEKIGNNIYITAVAEPGYVFSKWSLAPESNKITIANEYSKTTKFVMPEGTVSIIANFEKTEYDYVIKYNANGGAGAPTEQNKKHDENITLSTKTPVWGKYEFAGWTDSINSKTVKYMPGDTFKENKSVTLYAVWIKDCKVSFDANGGTVSEMEKIIKMGEAYGTLPTPIKTGNTFDGWYTKKNGGDKIDSLSIVPEILSQTLYAHWTTNSYTITFDSNGGSEVTPITQKFGTAVSKPADPKKIGYTFAGWNKTVPTAMPAENITLTAKWNLITYSISYNLVGGTVTGNPTSYTIETNNITLNNPTKVGYLFNGWTGSNGKTASKTVTIEKGSTGNKEYIANWIPDPKTIYKVEHWKQNVDGKDTENESNYTLITTDRFEGTTASSVTPKVKEYTGFTPPLEKTEVIAADGSTVIKYYYKRNSYQITFVTNGGSGVDSIVAKYEATITKPSNPTKPGYTFKSWDKTIPTKMPAENITITASWNIVTYSIKYTLNGGAVTGNPTTYTVETADITIKNPTKQGYIFAGWTGTDLAGKELNLVIRKGSTENRNYVANWDPATDTPYKVEHWQLKVDGVETNYNSSNYTLKETDNLKGTTDSSVTPAVKTYVGFTSPDLQTATIAPDGSTVIKYYYARTKYTVTFNAAGGSIDGLGSATTTRTVVYGKTYGDATAGFPTATRDLYDFKGWFTDKTVGTEVTTTTVVDGTKLELYAHWEESALAACKRGDHTYGDYVITSYPTCTSKGVKTATCSVCGATTTKSIAATGHDYTISGSTAGTCEVRSSTTYKCGNCGDTYTEQGSFGSHSYGAYKTTIAPTCGTRGTAVKTCTICGVTSSKTLEATGHSWVTDKAGNTRCEECGIGPS